MTYDTYTWCILFSPWPFFLVCMLTELWMCLMCGTVCIYALVCLPGCRAACPRNDLHTGGTYLLVERALGNTSTTSPLTSLQGTRQLPFSSLARDSRVGLRGEEQGQGQASDPNRERSNEPRCGDTGRRLRSMQWLQRQKLDDPPPIGVGMSLGHAQSEGGSWSVKAAAGPAGEEVEWEAVHTDDDWCTKFHWSRQVQAADSTWRCKMNP